MSKITKPDWSLARSISSSGTVTRRKSTGATLWFSGAWTVRATGRTSFQPQQAADRSYAKALDGDVQPGEAIFGYPWSSPRTIWPFPKATCAPLMPKAVVVDPIFLDWEGDQLRTLA